ncbi:MAG: LamG domain-containing protein [Lutibacter sp.]|nr:LamG domain-containing protein [Lutibacter sp.]
MKILKNIFIGILTVVFAISCNDGIDDITPVSPGADESAPVIKVNYPLEGTKIQVTDIVTSINIKFEVIDDIELGSITVFLDDVKIVTYSSFKDYRRAVEEYLYENLTNGEHVLKITATDLQGKTTTKLVNFMKVSPYTTKYDGEILYMPFDGDYLDLISLKSATVVGTPGYAGESVLGLNAFAGATDSYLKFPMNDLKNNDFSASFWYKVKATPDRAGILVVGNNVPENRNQGFRLFREGNATGQRIKLNVGTGTGESWNDGGVIDVTAGEWVHVAFTISQTKSTIYINGIEMLSAAMSAGIDWTGCETLTIGAGGETFSYWGHKSDLSYMDELRIFSKALTETEIQNVITDDSGSVFSYTPKYDGETFYMPFDGTNTELVSGTEPTVVGTPGFAGQSVLGISAYAGATGSNLTFPISGLFGNEFSGAFWYKVNATPDRAGILVVGNNVPENRNQGFRLFREGSGTEQRIKINVGTGTGESWNDGGVINVSAGEWVHIAFTVSQTKSTIYFNGVEKLSSTLSAGVDWLGCETLTIGAGGETFSYWNHLSDLSFMDELRLFNKALTPEEIQAIMNE